MNETLRRELARLREHNPSPAHTSSGSDRRTSQRQTIGTDAQTDDHRANLPEVTYDIYARNDVPVNVSPVSDEPLQHQITALREEVNSLRAALTRIFRMGANGFQRPP